MIYRQRQTGYVLILTLLGLMGMGGVVLAGFTQQAKEDLELQRQVHNQRVLEQAKQALLMYAYNYPSDNPGRGPGRLPCPDTTNNGSPNPSFNCINGNPMVGRFPWADADMNFFDARDASGERLWYAVGSSFSNDITPPANDVINSDTVGTITLVDQSGNIIYDGAVEGIAAVIIAPGPITRRDNDNNGTYEYLQIRNTAPQQNNPVNYLDTFNGFDNAVFNNSQSNTNDDGFILGPVFDPNVGDTVVNDQFVVVTADEVIAMAQKSTLDVYRQAIRDFMSGPGFDRYPWLDSYDNADPLTEYDADITAAAPAPVIGRVPSIFAEYFDVNADDSQPIISELKMVLNVDGVSFEGRAPASATPDVFFRANGDLVTSFPNGASFIGWAWDGHPTLGDPINSPNDGVWEMCPYVTGTEEDCNRDAAGNFMGGTDSDVWLWVRRITFTVNGASPFEFPIGSRTATPLALTPPTTGEHAFIAAEYDGTISISPITWSQDNEFQSSFAEEPPGNSGTLTYDAGDSMTVAMRYYPVLPRWAWFNNWHSMVQFAYSSAMQPGGDGVCNVGVDDCLTLLNTAGVQNDKLALLVISGNEGDDNEFASALIDAGGAPQYYSDDLPLIFEGENGIPDLVFDVRPANVNDVVLLVE